MNQILFLKSLLLIGMIFLHIIDDFHLQGMFKDLKQKIWWTKNVPDKKYKNDYIIALFEHSFSWTFSIMIIPAIYMLKYSTYDLLNLLFICFFMLNITIHAIIDDYKANKLKLNLIQDQLIHFIQIIVTWITFIIFN